MARRGTRTKGVLGSDPPKEAPKTGPKTVGRNPANTPRSLAIASAGVRTGEDFAGLMSALMSDVIEGRLTPVAANATCNAGGKLLKVVEMQYRYGKAGGTKPALMLTA